MLKRSASRGFEVMASSHLPVQVCTATLSRLLLNTARRFAYPFAPALSRGMGVPLGAVTYLIAVNQATGLLGVLFGPVADRFGYKAMMLAGLGMLVLGMMAGGLFPLYGVILVALFLAGLGKSLFDPALQAYIGSQIPYRRRALIIGILEFGWAGSTLLGVPLVGMMISVYGWKSPFFFLGGMGILAMVALAIVLPADERTSLRKCHDSLNLWKAWYLLARERAPLGALGFAFLASVANDNLFVVYGAWLEKSFGMSILVLGLGTTLIGTAELLGEGLTASFADRIGLKRSVIFGLALSSASYGVLPLLGKTISLSLTLLFFVFFIFEFTVVTTLSLCTELLPESRATMMSGFFAAAGLGRVVGALIGVPLWLFGGIVATGFASAAISGLAFVSLTWGLRGWDRQPPDGAQPTERPALWVSRHEHANRSHE